MGGGRQSGSVSVKVLRCRVEVYMLYFTTSILRLHYGYAQKQYSSRVRPGQTRNGVGR